MSTTEPLKCRMCANPAVGESIWCSDDCSEAYFAQEPPEDDEDFDSEEECECCGEVGGLHYDGCIYADEPDDSDWPAALKEDVDKGY